MSLTLHMKMSQIYYTLNIVFVQFFSIPQKIEQRLYKIAMSMECQQHGNILWLEWEEKVTPIIQHVNARMYKRG